MRASVQNGESKAETMQASIRLLRSFEPIFCLAQPDAAKHGDRPAVLEDNAVLAEKYYQWLRHLSKHNAVPDEAKTKKVFRGGLRLDLLRLAWTVQAGL
jgi:hypothetical protein